MREEGKEMPSFFSSSFDDATTATMMGVAPADAAEAPAKDVSEEDVAGTVLSTINVKRMC